ncbi:hypothetical protein [Flavobacterium piscisymbiosum]|uniref:Uncharacterized protein n=1 Tax=Flavobacterium piscisymbiosum TaxID=2893753 RepID=A0ABS8MJ54_9FLAO|nr:hypothetical protein [Flavobacterium sp. F-30]MCC9065534.1 hypothetical protein [Flavobacterium sp. F-30]
MIHFVATDFNPLENLQSFCHPEERRITLETPSANSSIFVDLRVRFFVPQNDKNEDKCLRK